MSGDILGLTTEGGGEGSTGVEAKDALKHPRMHSKPLFCHPYPKTQVIIQLKMSAVLRLRNPGPMA